MADYNVNMKQWNGSSFDNVLPLAFNSKALDGKSYDDIIQYAQSKNLLLYTGQYTGTGIYGSSNPTTLTFPFEPLILYMPVDPQNNTPSIPFSTNALTNSYKFFSLYSQYGVKIKKSNDKESISFYGSDEYEQYNISGATYYYAAIGGYDMGGQTEWTITSSGTWTVPKTGKYMLELYGKGGNGAAGANDYYGSGGASCQHYDSISLIKGNTISVQIGSSSIPSTSFGIYSIENATDATRTAGGTGTGNRGADGKFGQSNPNVFGTGVLSQQYGYGGAAYTGSGLGKNGGSGAVYLKYLGE